VCSELAQDVAHVIPHRLLAQVEHRGDVLCRCALAEQLESEGIPVTRRWRYLLVGAETEDDARALAQRLREEAPAETELIVEPNGQEVWREMHPYTVLGGLGN